MKRVDSHSEFGGVIGRDFGFDPRNVEAMAGRVPLELEESAR
jgi:hypothetical protein